MRNGIGDTSATHETVANQAEFSECEARRLEANLGARDRRLVDGEDSHREFYAVRRQAQ